MGVEWEWSGGALQWQLTTHYIRQPARRRGGRCSPRRHLCQDTVEHAATQAPAVSREVASFLQLRVCARLHSEPMHDLPPNLGHERAFACRPRQLGHLPY